MTLFIPCIRMGADPDDHGQEGVLFPGMYHHGSSAPNCFVFTRFSIPLEHSQHFKCSICNLPSFRTHMIVFAYDQLGERYEFIAGIKQCCDHCI